MRRKSFTFGILVILLLSSLLVVHSERTHLYTRPIVGTKTRAYVHDIIKINNNTDFSQQAKAEHWPGNGTLSNPYIISGYDIDAHGARFAIYIGNTTAHFVIENCYLHNISSSSGLYGGGVITIYNTMNGVVANNTIDSSNGGDGIAINSGTCDNILVINNTIYNHQVGIGVRYTYYSSNITIKENIIKNIEYWNSYTGILVLQGNNVEIVNNTISNHTNYGIHIQYSNNNFVSNNSLVSISGYGIYVESANNNIIQFNNISYAEKYGIVLKSDTSENTIYGNLLYNNNGSMSSYNSSYIQASDEGDNNHWNSTSGIGNYWLDWAANNETNDNNKDNIVDWPYLIDGSAKAVDYYPLKNVSLNNVISHPLSLRASSWNKSINLSWQPPLYGSKLISKYNIYRNGTLISYVSSNQVWYNDTRLVNGITYSYYVTAVNSESNSTPSNIVYAKPMTVPCAPKNLTGSGGYKYINLTWDIPSCDGGSYIQSYRVYRNGTFLDNVSSNQLWFNDTTTAPGVNYTYYVTALNTAGESKQSNEIKIMSLGEPSKPENLTARAGKGYVHLSWEPPLNDGGLPLIRYNIYRNNTSLANVSSNKLVYNDTSVSNGIEYTYYVTAVNEEGESAKSNEISVTPMGVPSPPNNLKVSTGNKYVNITWNISNDNGGSAILKYNIYRNSTVLTSVPASQLYYNDTEVVNGITYTYYITAVNSVGESEASTTVNAMPVGEPSAPRNLIAHSGNKYVNLSWEAPSNNGGDDVIAYKIYRSGALLVEVPSSQLYYNDTNVSNGITYIYYVTALNSEGESKASNEVSTTPMYVPDAPIGLNARFGNEYIMLTWRAPSNDGGATITEYRIYRNGSLFAEVSSLQLYYNDTDVVNGVTYTYYVTALNAAGESAKSNEVSATPMTVPSAPLHLKARSGNRFVNLSWQAPSDDGGAAIIDYKIYRNNTLLSSVSASQCYYNDTTVVNGVTYTYFITAVNSAGEGNKSISIQATPYAPTYTITFHTVPTDGGAIEFYNMYYKDGNTTTTEGGAYPIAAHAANGYIFDHWKVSGEISVYDNLRPSTTATIDGSGTITAVFSKKVTKPSAPQNLNASASDGKIVLAWQAPINNGGSNITYYKIYRGTSSGAESYLDMVSGSTLIYVDINITKGQIYYYYVTAVNSVGESNASNEVSVIARNETVIYTLTLYTSPASGGTIIFIGNSCSNGDTMGVEAGKHYNIDAIPAAGFLFEQWRVSGGITVNNNSSPYTTLFVKGNGTVTAVFVAQPNIVPPSPPTNLHARFTNGTVLITWHAPSNNGGAAIIEYKIYRSTEAGDAVCIANVSGSITSYSDKNIVNGTTYYYYITAVNSAGESNKSNVVNITIPVTPNKSESQINNQGELGSQLLWILIVLALASLLSILVLAKRKNRKRGISDDDLTPEEREILNAIKEYLKQHNGEKIDVLIEAVGNSIGVEPRKVILMVDHGVLEGVFVKETDDTGDMRVYFFNRN